MVQPQKHFTDKGDRVCLNYTLSFFLMVVLFKMVFYFDLYKTVLRVSHRPCPAVYPDWSRSRCHLRCCCRRRCRRRRHHHRRQKRVKRITFYATKRIAIMRKKDQTANQALEAKPSDKLNSTKMITLETHENNWVVAVMAPWGKWLTKFLAIRVRFH